MRERRGEAVAGDPVHKMGHDVAKKCAREERSNVVVPEHRNPPPRRHGFSWAPWRADANTAASWGETSTRTICRPPGMALPRRLKARRARDTSPPSNCEGGAPG